MSKGMTPRPSGVSASDAVSVHRSMRQQSLRVEWRELAEACERLIEWRSFALWVRAIVDAERAFPEWLKECIDNRDPGILSDRPATADHDSIWLDISAWAETRVFAAARDGGWLEALHYYSGRYPQSEHIWRHWEEAESEWRNRRPESYPSFDEWHQQALTDIRANRREIAVPQTALKGEIAPLVPQYIEWEAFAFWVRSVVDSAREIPAHLANEIERRCPGFLGEIRSAPASEEEYSTWLWRALLRWIEENIFSDVSKAPMLEALRTAARNHLRAERIAAFWAACGSAWVRRPPNPYPSFEQWLSEADAFVKP